MYPQWFRLESTSLQRNIPSEISDELFQFLTHAQVQLYSWQEYGVPSK